MLGWPKPAAQHFATIFLPFSATSSSCSWQEEYVLDCWVTINYQKKTEKVSPWQFQPIIFAFFLLQIMSNISFVCLFQSLLNLNFLTDFQQLLYKANIWHANQMSHILSILDCQDIYIGTKAARWGGPRIRIKSRRSTIQNWRLKIEHVQRIKVDRDSSPNQVARRTLEHWAIWYLAMVDLVKVMLLGQLSPNLPACSQFTGLPACRRNAPTFEAEYSTRKFFLTLELNLRKFQPRRYSIVQFFVLGIRFCWNFCQVFLF